MKYRPILLVALGMFFLFEALWIFQRRAEFQNLLQAGVISERIVEVNRTLESERLRRSNEASTPSVVGIIQDDGMSFLKQPRVIGRSSSDTVNISPQTARLSQAATVIRSSADFAKLNRLQQYQALVIRYGPLITQMNLDPAKRDKLLQLLDDKQNVASDVAEALEVGRLPPDTPVDVRLKYTREAIAAESSRLDAEIKSTVGPDNYDSVTNYEKNAAQFLLVAQLQQALIGSGANLSAIQISNLQKALSASRDPDQEKGNSLVVIPADSRSASVGKDGMLYAMLPPNGVYVSPAGRIFSSAILTDKSYSEVTAILHESQIAVMDKIIRQQKAAGAVAAGYQMH